MKFRKRITIIPGVRLNISGSGVSVTGGVPGLSVNVGKRGTYLNTGIPGTGLYERTRLDAPGGRSRGGAGGSHAARDGGGSGRAQGGRSGEVSLLDLTGDELVAALSLEFRVEEDGTVGTFLPNGEAITDPRILRKVRRSSSFRERAEALRESFVEDCEREMAAILEVHRRTPAPLSVQELRERLAEPPPEPLPPREFGVAAPQRESIAAELTAAARRLVGWWPFWSIGRRRRAYVAERLDAQCDEATARWRSEKERHDRTEAARVAEENRRRRERYDARRAHLQALLAGGAGVAGRDDTAEAIAVELEELLATVDYPLPFDIDYGVEEDGTVVFDVDMPEIEDLPDETARILSTGKLSVKEKSGRQRRREYATVVAGLALFIGGHAFAAAPAVPAARVRGYTQTVDPATGNETDVTVVDVTFDRRRFERLNPAAGEAVAMVAGFSPTVSPEDV